MPRPARVVSSRRAAAFVACLAVPPLTAARAQTVTLPTVRVGAPPAEQRHFDRLMQELRAVLAPDAGAAVADAAPEKRRAVERSNRYAAKLDTLLRASVSDDQLEAQERLARQKGSPLSVAERAAVLAGDEAAPTDPHVARLAGLLDAAARSPGPGGRVRAWACRGWKTLRQPAIRERDAVRLLREALADPTLTVAQHEKVDSASRLATALVVYRKFDERDGCFPVHNRAQAEVFWGQRGLAPLNVGSVGVAPSGGVAFTELAAPILGPFRMAVSAVIANRGTAGTTPEEQKKAQDAALQHFLTAGGLVNLAAAWPLFHGPGEGRERAVTLLFVPRLGFTAPKLGSQQTDSTTLVLDSGVELHGKFLDLVGGVGLTGMVRYGAAVGSRRWGESVGLRRDRLGYLSTGFGFAFARQYQILFTRTVAGPRAVRRPDWTVGLAAVRMPTL